MPATAPAADEPLPEKARRDVRLVALNHVSFRAPPPPPLNHCFAVALSGARFRVSLLARIPASSIHSLRLSRPPFSYTLFVYILVIFLFSLRLSVSISLFLIFLSALTYHPSRFSSPPHRPTLRDFPPSLPQPFTLPYAPLSAFHPSIRPSLSLSPLHTPLPQHSILPSSSPSTCHLSLSVQSPPIDPSRPSLH